MLSRPAAVVHLPEPRLLVVLAGAATHGTRTATALERATVPSLAAMAERGHCGRLRTIPPHLPVEEGSSLAALLGTALPEPLDPGTLAAEASGALLAPGERCGLVEVLDHAGEPAPALHVARAVEVLRGRLPRHRVVAVRRGNQVLLAGATGIDALPSVQGLELRLAPAGYLPERPALDERTVVVATAGSIILGVARLLGARALAVDGVLAGGRDLVPARLRSAGAGALLHGASTVIVEAAAPLLARRGHRDEPARERAVAAALSQLDRELIGPLRTAAAWRGAGFVVTADVARRTTGQPVEGDVPIIVAAAREHEAAEPAAGAALDGVLLPPRYSERGVAERPIVTSPFAVPPARDPDAPLRFRRDPATGVTVPDYA